MRRHLRPGRLRGPAVAATLLLLASAHAAAGDDVQANADCGSQPTQAAMNACARADFEQASAAHAAASRQLAAGLGAAQRERLRRMQQAWLGFRTAACRFEAGPTAGGSLQAFVYWSCAARLTRQRTAELQGLAVCVEGDVTCTPAEPAPR